MKKHIKVSVIEDREHIRNGLMRLINGSEGLVCGDGFGTMEEALADMPKNLPDVVLCDIGLPGMDGIEGTRILKKKYPDLIILVLSVYDDDDRVIDAICAGATGYLLKNTPAEKILDSLKDVIKGGAPMSPEIARRVIHLFRQSPPPKQVEYDLTPHELRILKMLVDGHSYKTAASELGVTVHAVSFHMRNIYDKLHVHSKSEAVAKALKNRLV